MAKRRNEISTKNITINQFQLEMLALISSSIYLHWKHKSEMNIERIANWNGLDQFISIEVWFLYLQYVEMFFEQNNRYKWNLIRTICGEMLDLRWSQSACQCSVCLCLCIRFNRTGKLITIRKYIIGDKRRYSKCLAFDQVKKNQNMPVSSITHNRTISNRIQCVQLSFRRKSESSSSVGCLIWN